MQHFIEFESVCKFYKMGQQTIAAADHISFHAEKLRTSMYSEKSNANWLTGGFLPMKSLSSMIIKPANSVRNSLIW